MQQEEQPAGGNAELDGRSADGGDESAAATAGSDGSREFE